MGRLLHAHSTETTGLITNMARIWQGVLLLTVLAWVTAETGVLAQMPAATEAAVIPPPLTTYQGRTIARTMHYRGAEWLTRDSREQEERCSLMLANLGVRRGMKICDMGCGNGFYSVQLAQMVGPEGQIYGVDIQPEMLAMLKQRAAAQQVQNVTAVQGTVIDPQLPPGKLDMILCVDVYHEFSH
ncbi:MAG: class I SAM-dependent methyltransferase, partial [Pirellulaceae bacterium]